MQDVIREHRSRDDGGRGAVVLGGGCAGLALTVALAEAGVPVTMVEARPDDRDHRTWCYWDTGESGIPEAVSASWTRWEVRTATGRAVAEDPRHPYRMVRAADYRLAARRRLAGSALARHVEGVRVLQEPGPPRTTADGTRLFDARGASAPEPLPPGRVRLQQRFFGQWVRTARPVFDDTTVTLMDFTTSPEEGPVRFVYVLPVAPDLALVESTVFARNGDEHVPHRAVVADYVRTRWGLESTEWHVEGEEAGCIPMSDVTPPRGGAGIGLRGGAARPSTGYAFTRIQRAARAAARATATGRPAPPTTDRPRTRALDAVFLRFLRDQPRRAPAVFLRMFGALPADLTVRFLTERSSVLDDLRLIVALPKRPFLRAAVVTARERLLA